MMHGSRNCYVIRQRVLVAQLIHSSLVYQVVCHRRYRVIMHEKASELTIEAIRGPEGCECFGCVLQTFSEV
jgi:hypothetical protein